MQDYTAPPSRPTSVTVIAIVAIVLGSLSTCCGLYAGFGLVMTDRLQAVSDQMAQVGQPEGSASVRAQREMQAELVTFQAGWAPFTGSFVVIQLLVALLSILGGALALSAKPIGRSMLIGAFGLGTVFELGRSVVETLMQFQVIAITQRYMSQIVAASQNGRPLPPGFGQTMGAVMGGASIAGIVFMLLWALIKIGYYVSSIVLLRREEVRRFFG